MSFREKFTFRGRSSHGDLELEAFRQKLKESKMKAIADSPSAGKQLNDDQRSTLEFKWLSDFEFGVRANRTKFDHQFELRTNLALLILAISWLKQLCRRDCKRKAKVYLSKILQISDERNSKSQQ